MISKPNGHDRGNGRSPLIKAPFVVTLNDWLSLNVAPPDFVMGELLSTTSRALLVGPTGLGKTNFCLSLAMAMAAGADFLRWRARRPCNVLYIDGEMSRRLLKARLLDALRRLGCGLDRAVHLPFHAVSREEVPDMPPLNTAEGQDYFDRCVIGNCEVPDARLDFIFFDNIQALLAGNMVDEDAWQLLLPWLKTLTARNIGQLWVHHTGHDESRGYGTSTREWQLDSVGLMERVERPNADIAFGLKFTKARERAPHNRADFEPMIITLAKDRWDFESADADSPARPAKPPKPKTPSPLGVKFHSALTDAAAAAGEHRQESAGLPSVTTAQWEGELRRLGLLPDSDDRRDRNRRAALIARYRAELIAADWIAANAGMVWSTRSRLI